MTMFKCSPAAMIAVLLLSIGARSADATKEAYKNGMSCLGKNDYDAAITAFAEALRLDPKNVDAYYKRGLAYEIKCDYDNAITDFTTAIRLNPSFSDAYSERGNAFDEKGKHDKAIADYSEAIRLKPKSSMAYYNRGITFGRMRDFDKAIADFSETIRLKPTYAAYCRRGAAYCQRDKYDKALADLNAAIWFNPKSAEAYGYRGTAFDRKGDYDKAIADFNEGIRLEPKDAVSHNGLAWLRATCPKENVRDGQLAIDHATKACELTDWKFWGYVGTLAAANAEARKFEKAVEFQQKAVEMATNDKEKNEMRERLKLYQAGTPYRDVKRK